MSDEINQDKNKKRSLLSKLCFLLLFLIFLIFTWLSLDGNLQDAIYLFIFLLN